MIFVDTSHWLALAVRSDALHDQAMGWSARIASPCITTEYGLIEFVNRLSAPALRPRAHAMLIAFGQQSGLTVIPSAHDLFEAGMRLHRDRPDKHWSLTDCISFVVMTQHGILEALTHDDHFEQAGFVALLRRPFDAT